MAAVHPCALDTRPAGQLQAWERWLTKSQDWCVSRQLWWGHRVPAYRVDLPALPPRLSAALTRAAQAPGPGGGARRVCLDGTTLWVVAHDGPSAVESLVGVRAAA